MKSLLKSIFVAVTLFVPLLITTACNSQEKVDSNEVWKTAFAELSKANSDYQVTEYYHLSENYRNHLESYEDGYYTKYYINDNKYKHEQYQNGDNVETDYYELADSFFKYTTKYEVEGYIKRKPFISKELSVISDYLLETELTFINDTAKYSKYFDYSKGNFTLKQNRVAQYARDVFYEDNAEDNYTLMIKITNGKISQYEEKYDITYIDYVKAKVTHIVDFSYDEHEIILPSGDDLIIAEDLATPVVSIEYSESFEQYYIVWESIYGADVYGLFFTIDNKKVYSFGTSSSPVQLNDVTSVLKDKYSGQSCVVKVAAISWDPLFSDSVSEGISFIIS